MAPLPGGSSPRAAPAERFCVRNSGADVVVEGCGSNGCEYMTGGTAVILGTVGDNFGAGMTGGMAFVWDGDGRFMSRVNAETLEILRISSEYWETRLIHLVQSHVTQTASPFAREIARNWESEMPRFWQICPKEMVSRLAHPLSEEQAVVSA